MESKIVLPDEARTLRLNDVLFRWGVGSEATNGALSILEVTIPPRTLIKPHTHRREDEFSLILSGPIGVRTGDRTVEDVPTGSWLIKPRSVPHAMWNVSDQPARVLEVVTPGGLEHYFEEIAPILREHGPEWTERYNAAAEKYGLEILTDWTDELTERYGVRL